jgi:hypothetical protein
MVTFWLRRKFLRAQKRYFDFGTSPHGLSVNLLEIFRKHLNLSDNYLWQAAFDSFLNIGAPEEINLGTGSNLLPCTNRQHQ